MDASLPGRLLILQSAPVYLLFTQAPDIQPRSQRHLTPTERSMSGSAFWKLELEMRSCFVGNVVAVFKMLKPSFMRCRNGVVFFSALP